MGGIGSSCVQDCVACRMLLHARARTMCVAACGPCVCGACWSLPGSHTAGSKVEGQRGTGTTTAHYPPGHAYHHGACEVPAHEWERGRAVLAVLAAIMGTTGEDIHLTTVRSLSGHIHMPLGTRCTW